VTPLLQSAMAERHGGKGLVPGFCGLALVEDTEQATVVFSLVLPQPPKYAAFSTDRG